MITAVFPIINSIRMNLAYPPERRYIPRAFLCGSLIFLQQPFHWLELIFSKRKIESTEIRNSPIIILGYWRSGTTFLQRLLCTDPSSAYLTQYEAFFPLGSGIHSKFFKPIVNELVRLFRIKHPSHKDLLEMDYPSEEDIALCAAAYPHTPMWSHIYSANPHHFDKLLLCENGSVQSTLFIKMFSYLVKRLSYLKQNKRLILKSPSNTTKIREILRAFPSARFIYIERDPVEVFFSNIKLLSNNRHQWLQSMTEENMTDFFNWSYPEVIGRYQMTKRLIPDENLIEIRFDDLRLNPKKLLRQIYSQFNLPQFEEAAIDDFLQRNTYKRTNYQKELPQKVRNMFDEVTAQKNKVLALETKVIQQCVE